MTHKYLYTRQGDKEEVLHVGETETLVGFTGDHGIAETLAEMKTRSGQPAEATELSVTDLETAKGLAKRQKEEFEANKPVIAFKP